MIWTDDISKKTAGMGPGSRIFFNFCDFCFSLTKFRTRFWPRCHMPRGCTVMKRKGLGKLINFGTRILKIGPKLRELWP